VGEKLGRGSYILLVKIPEEQTITIGRLGVLRFTRGSYAYVGSAMGGFTSRLPRHLRREKKVHWHIDYLLQKASVLDIITAEAEHRLECTIAQALAGQFEFIPGFGSSDCRCRSHLFFASEEWQMRSAIEATMESLSLKYHTR
jgi:sugar fermentation stimulation protein A